MKERRAGRGVKEGGKRRDKRRWKEGANKARNGEVRVSTDMEMARSLEVRRRIRDYWRRTDANPSHWGH